MKIRARKTLFLVSHATDSIEVIFVIHVDFVLWHENTALLDVQHQQTP